MTSKKRQKRLAKLKKLRNILKNNVSHRHEFRWVPANSKVGDVIGKTGENTLVPEKVDSDWEYENYKQEKLEREEEWLKNQAERDLRNYE